MNIFRFLGTPNEQVCPGVTKLKDWHIYPEWKPQALKSVVPDMEPSSLDLLSEMLVYEPSKRISAKKAGRSLKLKLAVAACVSMGMLEK